MFGNLNPELWLVFLPPMSSMLFALGGTEIQPAKPPDIPKIKGQKWFRRFVLPTIYFLCVWGAGFTWWQGLLIFFLASFAFHQPYGSGAKSWWRKLLTFAMFGLPALVIGWSWWSPITFVGASLAFYLGDNKPWKTWFFKWKVFELTSGLLVGIQIAYLLVGYGVRW